MRIAVAGIGHETNTFSTLRTRLEDFWVRRGDEVLSGDVWSAFRPEVEFVPILVASAIPNGLVEESTYRALKHELIDHLRESLPVDGVYLVLHGAMHVESIGDGETDLAAAVREVVGPEIPIAASLDLHGNLSPEFVSSVNILSALRTAPHVDGPETRKRTLELLIRSLRTGVRPMTAMVKLPLILAGESAVTAIEPSKSLYGQLNDISMQPGIWDASLMIGCAWTDSPYTSVSTLVVGDDLAAAQVAAQQFAERVWERRAEFGPEGELLAPDDAIARAIDFPRGPVFISDSGDNPTAGGAGDSPYMLSRLIAAGAQHALIAGIADSDAIEICSRSKPDEEVRLKLGGKLDATNHRPFDITAKLLWFGEGLATIQVEGITVLLSAKRRPFLTLKAFEAYGIDPFSYKIVVVKQGYLDPVLRERSSYSWIALSPGFTDQRIESLPYQSLVRPIYPLDPL